MADLVMETIGHDLADLPDALRIAACASDDLSLSLCTKQAILLARVVENGLSPAPVYVVRQSQDFLPLTRVQAVWWVWMLGCTAVDPITDLARALLSVLP